MSAEEKAEVALRVAVNEVLKIPRPDERRKIFMVVFNELLQLGQLAIESRIV